MRWAVDVVEMFGKSCDEILVKTKWIECVVDVVMCFHKGALAIYIPETTGLWQ